MQFVYEMEWREGWGGGGEPVGGKGPTQALAGLPIVVVGTWLGRHLPPPVTEQSIKKFAYWLLIFMGVWILVSLCPVCVGFGAKTWHAG